MLLIFFYIEIFTPYSLSTLIGRNQIDMRQTLLFILFLSSFSGFCQSFPDSLLKSVENGLVKQTLLPFGENIQTKNIYDQLKARKVNGTSIAVINNYKIEWAKAYGVADNSRNNPLTTETLFQSASIGKVITAMAALRLVRENKISLDENVNNKLSSWKIEENEFTSKEKVTLRRLLSHSAGLFDDYGFEGYEPKDKIPTLLQILRNEPPSNAKKKIGVEAVPGTVERYSGGGFLIVQQLIEDVSGQPYEEYVGQHLFDKLEMTNTTYDFRPDLNLKKEIARGHYENGKVDRKKAYHIYPEMAAAGPWTTAIDLAKLVIQIQKEYEGKSDLILGQALCKEMLTPQINFKGLSLHLKGVEKPEAFWHAGNNAGYVSLLYGMVSSGQGAVVLTNSDSGEHLALEIMTSIANTYDWPVMQTYVSLAVTKEEMRNYSGVYQADNGTTVTIGENAKGLFIIPASPKKELSLFKIQANRFTVEGSPDYLAISFDKEAGLIRGVTIMEKFGKVNKLKKIVTSNKD